MKDEYLKNEYHLRKKYWNQDKTNRNYTRMRMSILYLEMPIVMLNYR